jgi:hypothetical protein
LSPDLNCTSDTRKYIIIIIGTASNFKNNRRSKDEIIKIYLSIFSFKSRVLNLREISGTSATKSILMIRQNISRNHGFRIKSAKYVLLSAIINGKEAINSALAGVGRPMKFSD